MTVRVEEDFVDHVHIYTAPSGAVFVQHDRGDGTTAAPERAIALLIQAARSVAAAHNIALEEG
jgi:hypothetical protein